MYPSRYHLVNMDLTLNGVKIHLKGAVFAGQFHVVSGSNGFISWASAPISVDLHETYVDDLSNNEGGGHTHGIDVREKPQREVKTVHTKSGFVISGLLFNEIENVPVISFSHPFVNNEKKNLNIVKPLFELPYCQTIECAIDSIKSSENRPMEYIIIDDKRIAHSQSGIIPVGEQSKKMKHFNQS